jgi:PAS domain S-box-containing protein
LTSLRFCNLSRITALVILCLLFRVDQGVSVQPQNKLLFQQVSLEDGLSQSTVNGIVQDTLGFIWLGTTDGLNRYDGHHVKTYSFDRYDEQSLSNNYILDMVLGPNGKIWIATYGGGVNIMDPVNQKVEHLRYQPPKDSTDQQSEGLISDDVITLHFDNKDRLWVGTDQGITLFNPQDSTFTQFRHTRASEEVNRARDFTLDLEQGPDGKIWVASPYGLELLDPMEGTFTQEMFTEQQKKSIGWFVINSLYRDGNGHLWIGMNRHGLRRIDNASFHNLPLIEDETQQDSLSQMSVTDITSDRNGTIWVATSNGLRSIHTDQGRLISYEKDLVRTHGLKDDELTALFIDRSENLWIGTSIAGALHTDLKSNKFSLIRQGGDDNKMNDRNEIWAIHQSPDSSIWMGTSDGLYSYNRKDGTYQYHKLSTENSPREKVRVSSIVTRDERYLWMSTDFNGLIRFDRKTGEQINYTPESDKYKLSSYYLSTVYLDKEDRMWVGTYESGFDIIDMKTGSVESVSADNDTTEGMGQGLVSNEIQQFYEDSKGRMWIGTLEGLSMITTTGSMKTVPITIDQARKTDNFSINTITEDDKGNIWLGTDSGILIHDPDMGTFTYLNETNGLPDNFIYGLLRDEHGGFWASTNRGLSHIQKDPNRTLGYRFRNYDVYDGIQNNEFNSGAFYRTDNELFFGGINGLTYFDVNHMIDNPYKPPVVISTISKIKKSKHLDQNLLGHDSYTLNYGDNVIELHFAALDFTQPQKNSYAYQLVGFDEDWIYSVDKPSVIYTNLNPGKYTFRVKASNNDGLWNEKGDSIELIIVPPFWQTTWFYLLVGVGFIGLVWGIIYWRARQDRRIQNMLREKVKERTHELEESEQQFRLISENAADLISVIDEDGEFIYVSPSHHKLLGYSKEDLIGRDVKELIHPDDLSIVIEDYKRLLKGEGQIQFHEYRMIRKDGATSMFQTAGSFVKNGTKDSKQLVLISHDVTHRKLTEFELKRARDEAEKANRSKSAFLAGISHELRTPLNAILGYSQILKRDRMLTDRQKNYVETMYRSGNHLLSMINDVLDISKIEAGRMEVHNDPFDLRELMEDIRKLFTLQCKEKELDFYLELDDQLPDYVYADAGKLRQVLINLIGNAVKFTDGGHIMLRATARPIDQKQIQKRLPNATELEKMNTVGQYRIDFSVKDTGKGISKDQLDTIFEPFQQGDSNHQEGTGLGLAISSRIIQMLGGDMTVESQLGNGSTFQFHTPMVELRRPEEVEHESTNRIKQLKSGQDISVLLVDDIEYNLRLMRDLLEPLGFSCYEAQNGQEAITLFKKHRPDLVLMDLRMPTMRGEEAMVEMREFDSERSSTIFAVSASGFKGTRDELLALGFDEYLRKPIEDQELLRRIEEYMDVSFERESVDEAEENQEAGGTVSEVADVLMEALSKHQYKEISEAVELMELESLESLLEEYDLQEMNGSLTELHRAIDARDYVYLLSLNEVLNPQDKVDTPI